MLTAIWVAPVLAGLAGWLLVRPVVDVSPSRIGFPVAMACGGAALLVLGPSAWGLLKVSAIPMVLLAVVVLVAWQLRARSRRRSVAIAAATGLQVACDGLATSLAAGLPVSRALEVAVGDWPRLELVERSVRLGADVSAAFRTLAEQTPGASDLRLVAAAWHVAERGGAGLAEAVGSIAALVRRRQATRRLVRSELASARATARMMAGLPLLTLGLGFGLGGDPIAFLLTHGVGQLCLAGGLVFAIAGIWWIELIADAVETDW